MISSFKDIDSKLILAVDLKKGKVVRAFAGFRLNYKPLKLGFFDFSDPITFINKVLDKLKLNKIYIADLDAIQNLSTNNILIEEILLSFPQINFLIDAGFDYPSSANNFSIKLQKKKILNFNVVIGTEKMKKYNLQCFNQNKKIYISLDIKGETKKWITFLKKSKFKPDIILMFLRNIGGRGIRLEGVKKLIQTLPNYNFHYAGGIKYFNHIKMLQNVGVESVIASTLVLKHLDS